MTNAGSFHFWNERKGLFHKDIPWIESSISIKEKIYNEEIIKYHSEKVTITMIMMPLRTLGMMS